MKTIKNFLCKKRFRVLKNKRGFSLVEMLVTVGIVGSSGRCRDVPAYNELYIRQGSTSAALTA